MTIRDAVEFKEALSKYEIKTRHQLKFTKNTKQYVRMQCKKGKCPWKISGSFHRKTKVFQVIFLNDVHACSLVNYSRRLSSHWLADYLLQKFHSIPSLKLHELQQLVKSDLKLEVTLSQCWRAKRVLIKKVKQNAKEEFKKLWSYVMELRNSNKGNTVILECNEDNCFKRIYVAFECCKKGFLAGCRRVIGLDGAFLRGIMK